MITCIKNGAFLVEFDPFRWGNPPRPKFYEIFWKNISMNKIKRFSQSAVLGALLLCFNAAFADDIQDANK